MQKSELNSQSIYQTVLLEKYKNNLNYICQKTGAKFGQIAIEQIEQIAKIHGEQHLAEILPLLQISVLPHWTKTDPKGLQNLAKFEPVHYCVYVLFELCGKSEKRKTKNWLVDETNERARVFKNLQNLAKNDIEQITTCAELCRRLLSRQRPLELQENLENNICPTGASETQEDFAKLILFLEKTLSQIKSGYYNPNQINARTKAREQLRLQKRLKLLTNDEIAIWNEISDFDFFQELARIEKTSKSLQNHKPRDGIAKSLAFKSTLIPGKFQTNANEQKKQIAKKELQKKRKIIAQKLKNKNHKSKFFTPKSSKIQIFVRKQNSKED